MKLILVTFAVMVRICMSYPVIQQNIDDLLFNALLHDMAFDIDDFKAQVLQKKEDALTKPKDTSSMASPSQYPFPLLNLENTQATINLTEQQTTATTATVAPASKPNQKEVTTATVTESTFLLHPTTQSTTETNQTETPLPHGHVSILDILTGSTSTTRSAAANPVSVENHTSTEASTAVTNNGDMTYPMTATSASSVTVDTTRAASAGYVKANVRVLWNKALGIVNDFTTEMSIIGLTNIFTSGVTPDRWHTTHESATSETTPSTVAQHEVPSSDYIDDVFSAVDDLSRFLADIFTLQF